MRDLSSRRIRSPQKIRFSWLAVRHLQAIMCVAIVSAVNLALFLWLAVQNMPRAELEKYTRYWLLNTN